MDNIREFSLSNIRTPLINSYTSVLCRFTEGEYWDSLEDTYLKQAVLQMGGLDAGVGVGGKKFSVGKRIITQFRHYNIQ